MCPAARLWLTRCRRSGDWPASEDEWLPGTDLQARSEPSNPSAAHNSKKFAIGEPRQGETWREELLAPEAYTWPLRHQYPGRPYSMSAIRLRLRGPGGGAVLNGATSAWTLAALKEAIEREMGVPAAQQRLLAGFPPKVVAAEGEGEGLAALGIGDGGTLVVEDSGPPAAAPAPSPALAPAVAADPGSSEALAQLCSMGFDAAAGRAALEASGGDAQAAVQMLLGGGSPPPPAPGPGGAGAGAGAGGGAGGVVVGGGSLQRRAVPADNSCLFNALAYVWQAKPQPPLAQCRAEESFTSTAGPRLSYWKNRLPARATARSRPRRGCAGSWPTRSWPRRTRTARWCWASPRGSTPSGSWIRSIGAARSS